MAQRDPKIAMKRSHHRLRRLRQTPSGSLEDYEIKGALDLPDFLPLSRCCTFSVWRRIAAPRSHNDHSRIATQRHSGDEL